MVLQPGPVDLPSIVQVFRTDKSHNGIDQKRGKMAGKSPVSALKVALAVTIGLAVAALAGLALYFLMK